MSVLQGLGQTLVTSLRAARGVTVGGARAGRFVGRNLLRVRERGAAGETGMLRLLDLHAASCAGDTLVALGLAGTVFFSVPEGEARGRVALYLVITMLPFALLAPVVGPVLDRFRHGRRYALAVTMLGRAFLAFTISEHLTGWALYPAAFGMLVLSRAYGVARSAAVPRVLPAGLGLSEAGARASVFGAFAGAIVLPIGLLADKLGPQWPLRLSIIVFFFGMVTSLRLPPRADSDPPEAVPRLLQRPGHKGAKVLSGRVVVASLVGSATLRGLYGFLTLFLAFAIKSGTLPVTALGFRLSEQVAVVMVAGSLGVGSFLATAVGTRLKIHRPALLQAVGIVIVTVVALIAASRNSLLSVSLLCLVTAVASGLAKLTVDAVIQERIAENVRASAFAHSETLLMVAWVLGGAVGLIPFGGHWGMIVAAAFISLGAARAVFAAATLRRERLRGAPAEETTCTAPAAGPSTPSAPPASSRPSPTSRLAESSRPAEATTVRNPPAGRAGEAPTRPAVPTMIGDSPDHGAGRTRRFGWRKRPEPEPAAKVPDPTKRMPAVDEATLAPPGYTLYRPSGLDKTARLEDEDR